MNYRDGDTSKAYVLQMSVELFLESSQSLKSKRRIIKSLLNKLSNNFNVSVAEIAYLDSWQRTAIGLVMISNDSQYLQKQAHIIEKGLLEAKDIEVLQMNVEII